MVQTRKLFALAALSLVQVQGVELDVNSVDSVKSAASVLAHELVQFYNGNETGEAVGVLPEPYYWWESGAFFNTLVNYWNLTGDSQYNEIVAQALLAQGGSDGNFMPPNQTKSLSNDDQATWALAALSAAEAGLPVPNSVNSLTDGAIAVFNNQVERWDDETCEGGLRWQIFSFNSGYDYKNSISNGLFFELAARLAHMTGNSTYSDWASKAYEWSKSVGFIDDDFNVFDGAHVSENCSDINKVQFTLNAGTYIAGSALMYNITTDSSWKDRLDSLLDRTLDLFFPDGVATEQACERRNTCNTDMRAFKGLLGQRLVSTVLAAPYTADLIDPILESTAKAAAKVCDSSKCPLQWQGTQTGSGSGVGEYLSALTYVQALLVGKGAGPSSNETSRPNGTSTGGDQPTPSGSSAPIKSDNSAAGLGSGNAVIGSLTALVSMAWLML